MIESVHIYRLAHACLPVTASLCAGLSSAVCVQTRWNRRGESVLLCRTVCCSSSRVEPRANGSEACAQDHLQWKNKSCKDWMDFVERGETAQMSKA